MSNNKNIIFITADLGFGLANQIKEDFPDRFFNVMAAEQVMMNMACGMSLAGKIPFAYSITPFLLYRPFETLRTFIEHEKLNVKMIGSGRDDDYKHDGYTHDGSDDDEILKGLPNIYANSHWPMKKEDIPELVKMAVESKEPFYINLKR